MVTSVEPGGDPIGLAVGSFTSVSLDPPVVAFLPATTSSTWPRIRATGRFCVNVLAADQEHVCRACASKAPDKLPAEAYAEDLLALAAQVTELVGA